LSDPNAIDPSHAQASGAERRRAERAPTHLCVDATHLDEPHVLELRQAGRATPRIDRVTNLSRRGLCLESTRRPDVGTHLVLRFEFDGERPALLIGATRWTRLAHASANCDAPPVVHVGVQLVGGSNHAFNCLERALDRAREVTCESVATAGDSR
jgi:hypothetical protein